MSGVLKAKVGGQWVPIIGSGMSAEVARWNSAWGIVAKATVTTSQSGIGGTATDVTGLTVTFTPVVGRQYRTVISLQANQPSFGTSAPQITDAANVVLQQRNYSVTGYLHQYVEVVEAGLAATPVVRKARNQMTPGTVDLFASPTIPAFIIVEDVGPVTPSAVAPANPTPAWTNLTLLNGYTAVSGRTPQYRMVGDEVQCRGTALIPASLNNYPFTFPAGYRPPVHINISYAGWQSNVVMGRIFVAPDGSVVAQSAPPVVFVSGGELPFDMVRFSVTP